MYVKYLGHACVFLKFEKISVVIDPFGDIGYKQEYCVADYCLTTHDHFDHNTLNQTKFNYLIDKATKIFPDFLSVVDSYHDEVMGAKRGCNSVYVIEQDGFKVCHLGDIGQPFDLQFCKKLGHIDLLFIPIGGKYTIDSYEAKRYADAIGAKITVPIHYKTEHSDIDISTKDEFLSYCKGVIKVPQGFEINSLPNVNVVYDVDDNEF